MADEPYVANLANSYVQTQDQNGDPEGKNFNGGLVVAPISNEVRSPIGSTSSPETSSDGEDPLFKAIAGNSQEFVGGIPKEKWDSLSPEQRDRLARGTEEDRRMAGYAGAAIGGAAGVIASLPTYAAGPELGAVVSGGLGGAGAAWGYNKGYDLLDKAPPPQPTSREVLREQYKYAKEHD